MVLAAAAAAAACVAAGERRSTPARRVLALRCAGLTQRHRGGDGGLERPTEASARFGLAPASSNDDFIHVGDAPATSPPSLASPAAEGESAAVVEERDVLDWIESMKKKVSARTFSLGAARKWEGGSFAGMIEQLGLGFRV